MELLVRVVDKTNRDPYLCVKLTKRGDVIAVRPDEWAWSETELADPAWRILRFGGATVAEAGAMLSAEQATGPEYDPMLQIRGWFLNLTAPMPAAMLAYLQDASRAEPLFVVPLTVTLDSLKRRRLPRADPKVIG